MINTSPLFASMTAGNIPRDSGPDMRYLLDGKQGRGKKNRGAQPFDLDKFIKQLIKHEKRWKKWPDPREDWLKGKKFGPQLDLKRFIPNTKKQPSK